MRKALGRGVAMFMAVAMTVIEIGTSSVYALESNTGEKISLAEATDWEAVEDELVVEASEFENTLDLADEENSEEELLVEEELSVEEELKDEEELPVEEEILTEEEEPFAEEEILAEEEIIADAEELYGVPVGAVGFAYPKCLYEGQLQVYMQYNESLYIWDKIIGEYNDASYKVIDGNGRTVAIGKPEIQLMVGADNYKELYKKLNGGSDLGLSPFATRVDLGEVKFLTTNYVGPMNVVINIDVVENGTVTPKTYTATDYFETSKSMNKVVITDIFFNEEYDWTGDYVYVSVNGENIDYTKIYPTLMYNGKEVTEKCGVIGDVYKLKKLSGFPELSYGVSFDAAYKSNETVPEIVIEGGADQVTFFLSNTGFFNLIYDAESGKFIVNTETGLPSDTVMNIQIVENAEYDVETGEGGFPLYDATTNTFKNVKRVIAEAKIKAPKQGTAVTFYDKNKKVYKDDFGIYNYAAIATWSYTSQGKKVYKGATSYIDISGTIKYSEPGAGVEAYWLTNEDIYYVKGDDIHCEVSILDYKSLKANTPVTFSIKNQGSSAVILSKTIYPGVDSFGQVNNILEAVFENVRLEAGTYDVELAFGGKVQTRTSIVIHDEKLLDSIFYQQGQSVYWQDYKNGILTVDIYGPRLHAMDEKDFNVTLYSAANKTEIPYTIVSAYKNVNNVYLEVKINDTTNMEYGLYANVTYGFQQGRTLDNSSTYYKANGWDEDYGEFHYGCPMPSPIMDGSGKTYCIDNPLAEECQCYIYSQLTNELLVSFKIEGKGSHVLHKSVLQPILDVDPKLSGLYRIVMMDKYGNVVNDCANNFLKVASGPVEDENATLKLIIAPLHKGEQNHVGIDADFEIADFAEYTWSSSDYNIIDVESGYVTAKNVGTATITAISPKGARGSLEITVLPYEMKDVSLNRRNVELVQNGDSYNLIASISPELEIKNDDISYTWTVSDPSVVEISSYYVNGGQPVTDQYGRSIYRLKGLKSGETTVTVTAKQGNTEKKAECVVRVLPNVVGSIRSYSVAKVGETVRLDVSFWTDYDRLTEIELDDPVVRELSISARSTNDCVQVTDAVKTEGCIYVKGLKPGNTKLMINLGADNWSLDFEVIPCQVTLCRDNVANDIVIPAVYGQSLGDVLKNYVPTCSNRKIFTGWVTDRGEYVSADTPMTNERFENPNSWKLTATYSDSLPADADDYVITEYKSIGYTYTGSAIKPAALVYKGTTLLKEGRDYTISYSRNVNVYDWAVEDYETENGRMPIFTITGKGNYCSKKVYGFYIEPKSIEDADIVIDTTGMTKAANNKVQKLVPTIKYGSLTLKKDKDFTVKYYNLSGQEVEPKDAGTYKVKIAGKGNYEGEVELLQKLTSKDEVLVSKLNVKLSFSKAEACGVGLRPTTIVKDGKTELREGRDYYVIYSNNVLPGKANVKIVGMGSKYFGEKTVTFTITGKSISSAQVTGVKGKTLKDGMVAVQDNILVTYKGETLVEGEDYIVSYLNNAKVGNASVVINGVGRYTGTKKVNFKISPTKLVLNNSTGGTGTVNMEEDPGVPPGYYFMQFGYYFETDYCKNGVKPQRVFTTVWGEQLVEGVDYTVSYKNNTSTVIKTDKNDNDILPLMIVKGKGKYEGTMEIPFKINKKALNTIKDVSVSDVAYKNAKNNWYSKVNITDTNGVKLVEGVDYRLEYWIKDTEHKLTKEHEPVAAGTVVKVYVYAIGDNKCNYKDGTMSSTNSTPSPLTVTYKVRNKSDVKDISKATFGIDDFAVYYRYMEGKPVIINPDTISVARIKDGKETKNLRYMVDYEIIAYYNNTKVGTATAVFRGKGEYSGTKKVTFKITPAMVL